MSMAYSLLLDSNEQLFFVQFHLGCCACILRNLLLLHLMFVGMALNSEVILLNSLQASPLFSYLSSSFPFISCQLYAGEGRECWK